MDTILGFQLTFQPKAVGQLLEVRDNVVGVTAGGQQAAHIGGHGVELRQKPQHGPRAGQLGSEDRAQLVPGLALPGNTNTHNVS